MEDPAFMLLCLPERGTAHSTSSNYSVKTITDLILKERKNSNILTSIAQPLTLTSHQVSPPFSSQLHFFTSSSLSN